MSDAEIEPLFSVLSVMSLELRGGVLELEQQTAEAKAVFARAAREETELGYHEPPLYIRPAAEAEASALMAAGDFSAAKAAYQAALLERPHSGFPLYGIALSSEKSGNLDDAAKEYRDFLAAWKNADPDLPQIAHAHAFLERHP
jgi:tetratricopeptide (TPR) repeat protein